jgi:hypothetical protein
MAKRNKITTKSKTIGKLTIPPASPPKNPVLDFSQAKANPLRLSPIALQTAKKARARPTPGVMNATERKYSEYLEAQRHIGVIVDWIYEPGSFKLAPDCHYRPDFFVVYADGSCELIDVKGYNRKQNGPVVEEDAQVKIKVAAERFWFFGWAQTWRTQDGWQRRDFNSRHENFPPKDSSNEGEQDAHITTAEK